jgi:hypothetical protein
VYEIKAVLGAYLVTGPEGIFRVTKEKTCNCGQDGVDYCSHVLAVARYLRDGGEKAPDPDDDPPAGAPAAVARISAVEEPTVARAVSPVLLDGERPDPGSEVHRFWFTPKACPICGQPVVSVRRLSTYRRGSGWRCTEGGYAHFYRVRYGHLRGLMTQATPPVEPSIVAIGKGCYDVQMPDASIHIVGIDAPPSWKGERAFCFTCNTDRCEGARCVRDRTAPIAIALPSPAISPAQAVAA